MSVRKIKQEVLSLLGGNDLPEIVRRLSGLPVKDVVNALFSAVCRGEDRVHWNGVRCMGIFVTRLAEKDMEEARIVMRRMLWALNDESGGIGWGIPESMAEVMCCHEGLAEEYIHMLVSYMREDGEELYQDGNFLEHESLQRGLLWGIGRLAEKGPQCSCREALLRICFPYLDSGDSAVRGLAARSLGILEAGRAGDLIAPLVSDAAAVTFYDDGRMQTVTVGKLAQDALEHIRQGDGSA